MTSEFAQPRLSRVKRRSSPARGYKFGCVCSYMAGRDPGILMTDHIGTNTPKSVPPRWGRPPFESMTLLKRGCANSEVSQEPLPLKPRILVKKVGRFSKRKNGFTKTIPWTENPGK